ncbi:hypothetical protein FDP41_011148 [Naegleria fowleri]|uniref:Uncharacterized protein n=1 Tax=Naegleria fowleri TaxID=5763 RepID=A0A6A5CC30_NAEFO|nr:uncharacterized protein FDP41_011148 [Naegleria fowleri]KAF0983170.1 hypothetical protein FDP41_011148 [Naegleria fowleri]CAG4716684.1 unnamed protein product [Naegleria fowleri]
MTSSLSDHNDGRLTFGIHDSIPSTANSNSITNFISRVDAPHQHHPTNANPQSPTSLPSPDLISHSTFHIMDETTWSEKSFLTNHYFVKFIIGVIFLMVLITLMLLLCMPTLSIPLVPSLLALPLFGELSLKKEFMNDRIMQANSLLLNSQATFATTLNMLQMNSLSFFPISSLNGTMSFNIVVGPISENVVTIVEITYMVDHPNEDSNPWLQATIRPDTNVVVNSGSPPNKSFVRSVKNLSGAQMYQHVIRFLLTSSSLLNSTQQIIDMFTLQSNAFSVNVNLANSTTTTTTTPTNSATPLVPYPTFSDEFFPGIYLYPAFVGFAFLSCLASFLIWHGGYRRRKNPAALGERETKVCRHCLVLSCALCCYVVVFLAIGSAPIFGMNRTFTKCCALFQSIYYGSDLVFGNSPEKNMFNIDATNKLERCVTIVPYQHLFWFGEALDTEEYLNRAQCVNDEYRSFTTYNYNMIIYLSVFLGVAVLCFPIFHCMITIYSNKLYMLTKKQHSGEVTISFEVVSN